MSAASDKAIEELYAEHQDLLERAYATALNQLAANAGKQPRRPQNPREAQAYIDKQLLAEE
ncbi:MAG: hypothetical protein AAGF48_09165 [Pseudomonadota bacterium]